MYTHTNVHMYVHGSVRYISLLWRQYATHSHTHTYIQTLAYIHTYRQFNWVARLLFLLTRSAYLYAQVRLPPFLIRLVHAPRYTNQIILK